MIRFGPQGIPLSSKGRTLKDGVQDVHMLGLSAMEVQFLRVHTNERFASEDEVGKKISELSEGFIIQVIQEGDKGDTIIWDPNHIIENGDILVSFSSPIAPTHSTLRDIGHLAKELDVMLSLHTPYHMNLCGDPEVARTSILWNIWGGVMASQMDARVVVTNIGAAHPAGHERSVKNLKRNIDEILRQFKNLKINCKLGLQPSPKPEIFGALNEVISICKHYNGDVIPVINFPNLWLRSGGRLKDKSDIQEIIDRVKPFYKRVPYYAQFAGVESSPGGEIYYSPIKRGELKFDPIAEYLLDAMPDMIIISISPLVEHDAMYMKMIYERILAKMELKKKKIEIKLQTRRTLLPSSKVKKPYPKPVKKLKPQVKKLKHSVKKSVAMKPPVKQKKKISPVKQKSAPKKVVKKKAKPKVGKVPVRKKRLPKKVHKKPPKLKKKAGKRK